MSLRYICERPCVPHAGPGREEAGALFSPAFLFATTSGSRLSLLVPEAGPGDRGSAAIPVIKTTGWSPVGPQVI